MARQDIAVAAPETRPARPSFTEQLIEPLSRLRSEFDRLFDDLPLRFPSLRFDTGFGAPALEMTETDGAYKLTAELPGIDSKDVDVSVEDGMLKIAGEKKSEREENERGYRLSERSYGRFERLVRLPAGAKADAIKAKNKNGVLTVTIPKDVKAASSARKIAVE